MVTKKFILLTVTAVLIISTGLYSQETGSVRFINQLADKEEVSVEEAVKFFMMVTANTSGSYNENLNKLKGENILPADFSMEPASELKRGLLAKMIARKLNLRDSMMYKILPLERYAFKACIAENIMQTEGSEWDAVSGGELIEIMTAVSVILETGGTK